MVYEHKNWSGGHRYAGLFTQLDTSPTHVKGTVFDLILTNAEDVIYDLNVNPAHPLMFSDHFLISFCMKYQTPSVQGNKVHYASLKQILMVSCNICLIQTLVTAFSQTV